MTYLCCKKVIYLGIFLKILEQTFNNPDKKIEINSRILIPLERKINCDY